MKQVNIQDVLVGDTIAEGTHRTEVKEIVHNACCSGGTHVNNRACYDRIAMVTITG